MRPCCCLFSFLFLLIVFKFQNSIWVHLWRFWWWTKQKKSDADFWVCMQKYVISAAYCWVCSEQTYSITFICTGPKKILNFIKKKKNCRNPAHFISQNWLEYIFLLIILSVFIQGTISVGIDATDLFDRYEEDFEDAPGGGFPHIDINRMHISQSIEVSMYNWA